MASERIRRRIASLLDEADIAAGKDDWLAVRARASTILVFDPDNVDAKEYLEAARRVLEKDASRGAGSFHGAHAGLTVDAVPTSFAKGRYMVKKLLGEGGKKRVFLAHDTVLDRDVAFGLIKTEALDEAARARVIREAQVMARLGDHPHIMPIFDLGREGDQPFMVLPLMPGGDVEGLIEDAKDHRLALERVIEVGVAVCKGLEFAHSRGVVHRDLKPGNVWLTVDGSPKIGDFGLALPLEQTRLTKAGMMVGTVAYMPPEQALGGEVTPKADLYSLGCMLYEMVTGRPPFLGDDHVAIIGQHINTAPVSPSWHRPDCPKPLDDLILRLLAKDHAHRPNSAGDVVRALEAIDLGAAERTAQASRDKPQTESRSLDSLAGGVFVGRQEETALLRSALESALSGRGRVVMLGGEPGIGKTRMAAELATYAGLRRCQVLWGRCYEAQGAPPHWPWVQAIRGYARSKDPERVREELGSGAAVIAEIIPDLRQAATAPDRVAEAGSPEEARFRLFDSLSTFLKTASVAQPIVIVLDDLHWADKPSLLFLEFIARELAGARILIVGTYRDVDLTRGHPLADTLGELNRGHLYDRIILHGLSEKDVANFVELASGVKPLAELASAIHRHTEGNPLFVTELVRLLVQEGRLTQDRIRTKGRSTLWSTRIPEGVREVIGRRLNRLTPGCIETLTLAAVLGREFTLSQLRAAAEHQTEAQVLDALDEAVGTRVLDELAAGGHFQFAHSLVRETLLSDLTAGRRVRLHARVAEALESLYGQEADRHAAELAYHYGRASGLVENDRLVRYATLAGEEALTTGGYEDALRLFEDAKASINSANPEVESARILFGLGRAQAGLFAWEDAWASLKQAYDTHIQCGDVAKAVAVAAFPFPATWLPGVTDVIQNALKLASSGSAAQARLLSRLGLVDGVEHGNYDAGSASLRRALDIAKVESDQHLELSVLANWIHLDMFHLRWRESGERVAHVIRLGQQLNRPHDEFMGQIVAFNAQLVHGDAAAALSHANGALACGERVRDSQSIEGGYLSLTRAHLVAGNWTAAREASDQGLEVWPDDPRLLGVRIVLESMVGDTASVSQYVERLVRSAEAGREAPTPTLAYAALSVPMARLLGGGEEHLDVAARAASALPDSATRVGGYALPVSIGQAVLSILRKDASGARQLYERIQSMRGAILFGISDERVSGLLARTFGDPDLAVRQLEQGIAFCEQAGYLPELAWTYFDYAATLRARDSLGDQDRSATLSDQALELARQLAMKPLIERIIAMKPILKA